MTSSAFNFEWIFFTLADKLDNYIGLDKFKLCQDPNVYYGVSCYHCSAFNFEWIFLFLQI